jgi:hypothetical protein
MDTCIFGQYTPQHICNGHIYELTNTIKAIIRPRAEAEGFNINNGLSHICKSHYNKYYTKWRGKGCIDAQCTQPLLYDKHLMKIVPNRCLAVFDNAPPSSLIHNACLLQFDIRYNTHPLYMPPQIRKRRPFANITNTNNDNQINTAQIAQHSTTSLSCDPDDKENKVRTHAP